MLYTYNYNSPIGGMILGSDGQFLTGLWFEGGKYRPAEAGTEKALPIFERTSEWLDIYFSGEIPDFTPSMRPSGTKFRLEVWEILKTIPCGHTVTYGEIARRLAAGRGSGVVSAQAVGGAVGHNPISVIIPCHRVIGADGSLVGYSGGIDKKAALLKHEKAYAGSVFQM